MEKRTIRTYSRRQPIAAFKSVVTFAPSCPNSTNISNIRESRLLDNTLTVSTFDDTFDRLAAGVVIQPQINSTDQPSSDTDSDDFFKIIPVKKEVQKVLREGCNDENEGNVEADESIYNYSNENVTGVKRKICHYKNKDENLEASSPEREENQHGEITVLSKKKRICLDGEQNEVLNTNQLKVIDELPTSTPREYKMRTNIDIYNCSPILLDNDIYINDKHTLKLSITPYENMSQEKTIQFLKPEDKQLNNSDLNHFNNSNEITAQELCNSKANGNPMLNENTIDNNLNDSKLLFGNKLLNETTIDIENDNNLLKNIDIQSNMEKQLTNIAPEKKEQKKNKVVSIVDSPLLFDDTEDNLDQFCKNKTVILNNIQDNFKSLTSELINSSIKTNEKLSVIHDPNRESITNENKHDLLENDSEFSPHDWTNDYNSSYEYLSETERLRKVTINSENSENDKNLQTKLHDSSIKLNNENIKTKSSILSKTDFAQSISNSSVTDTQNNFPINNIPNSCKSANIVSDNTQTDNIKNIVPDTNIIDNNTINIQNKLLKEKENVNEILIQESPIISFRTLRKQKLNQPSKLKRQIKINPDKNNDNVNNKHGTNNTSIKNVNLEQKFEENVEKNSVVILNNSNKDKFTQESEVIKISNNKDVNKSVVDSYIEPIDKNKSTLNNNNQFDNEIKREQTHKDAKNIDVKLNYIRPIVCITRIDKYINNKSPILSTKISKHNKISAVKKPKILRNIRTSNRRKKIDDKKITIMQDNIVEIENQEINFDKMKKVDSTLTRNKKKVLDLKNNYNKIKEAKQLSMSKELIVLVSKLEEIDENYRLPIAKKNDKKKIKTIFKKSKNVVKSRDVGRNFGENNVNVKNSINDLILNQNTDINLNENVLKRSGEVNCEADRNINNVDEEFPLSLKLKDPTRITMRRRLIKTSNKPLGSIGENYLEKGSIIEKENKIDLHNDSTNRNSFVNVSVKSPSVFLKPGKSWARSLSIINHFHNIQNLDELAIGRGKNWRHSVQSILNMQPEDVIQKDKNISPSITGKPRFSRGFSIRIIPSGKKSTLTDDFTDIKKIVDVSDIRRKTSVARKFSTKIRRDTLIETEDDLIRSAKDIILKRCKQTSYLPFNVCFSDSYIDCCRKIGEGVYGEVFLYENNNEKSVIKIIPIEGQELVNCEPQKKFHEILSEIIISQELNKLRFGEEYNTNGFVGVNKVMCIIGSYPKKLINLWKKYDFEKKSENDCPSMFNKKQLYVVLELAHGGQDLEAYSFQNALESYSIFIQTAFSLAIAEKTLEFEHRDLHWGNLLISKTKDANTVFKVDGVEILIPTNGVKVSVIDFTLSRMLYQGCKIFNDLATDPTLFTAQGEYQFDIYRMMKDNVNNDWQQFKPYTNILWLDYILDKMITAVRYKKKTTKVHRTNMEEMKALRKEIFNYDSAFDFIKNCKKITTIFNCHW